MHYVGRWLRFRRPIELDGHVAVMVMLGTLAMLAIYGPSKLAKVPKMANMT